MEGVEELLKSARLKKCEINDEGCDDVKSCLNSLNEVYLRNYARCVGLNNAFQCR